MAVIEKITLFIANTKPHLLIPEILRRISMERIKSINALWGFMLILIFLSISNAWSAPENEPNTVFAWKDGEEIYTKICAYCHEAQVGPQIRNRELPAAYIREIVRNGNRAMPAFRYAEIDDESLAKLSEFISQTQSKH